MALTVSIMDSPMDTLTLTKILTLIKIAMYHLMTLMAAKMELQILDIPLYTTFSTSMHTPMDTMVNILMDTDLETKTKMVQESKY